MQLILSLFSGVGLLDKAFQNNGFIVVSAGDIITGQDIRDFTGIKNRFDGVIGGTPCQDFSRANRNRPKIENSYGYEMIKEYTRIVKECSPTWYLLENVPNVPNVVIDGYYHQRIDINQNWYENINRLRHIQFGHKDNKTIQISRNVTNRVEKMEACVLASDDRSFKELCKLQGLPSNYDLPSFNVAGKKRAVGNGVPLIIGNIIAKAVKNISNLGESHKTCLCGCGRFIVSSRAKYYDYSCRKRAQRKRDTVKETK